MTSTTEPERSRTIADVAGIAHRFTDYGVPDPGVRVIYSPDSVWQSLLETEAALARAEADAGVIPRDAAELIGEAALLERLDRTRVAESFRVQAHPLTPLIDELARVAGEEAGGWVHWGATTQNIVVSSRAGLTRSAHRILIALLDQALLATADLAERGAEMVMAGRTHGQHAVPITFGFKAAGWADALLRSRDRLETGVGPCLRAMLGGAVGSFASLGEKGPETQRRFAEILGLEPMPVPSRAGMDTFAGYVSDLAIAATVGARIAIEIETLMQTEFGEAAEPVPEGSVGSSTMPHKRNPKLTADVLDLSAVVRAIAPRAAAALIHPHEADGAEEQQIVAAVEEAHIALGDLLIRLRDILRGLDLFPDRMRTNLALSRGLMGSEAVMLALGEEIGRDHAHRIVYEAAMRAATAGDDFSALLREDPRVAEALSVERIGELLDPLAHTGLSAEIARETARRVRQAVSPSH